MSLATRIRAGARGVWSYVGLILLTFALVELALRSLVPDVDDDPGPSVNRREADVFANAEWVRPYFREFHDLKEMRWEPYVYWRRQAANGQFIRIDERGLRETWNPELTTGAPRLFMFGGSTLWGTGARDAHTIPSELSRLLDERGSPALVFNFGETGYVSTQELIALVRELQAGNVPDYVVFYDGINDVISVLQNHAAGLPQNEVNRRAEFNLLEERGRLLAAWSRRTLKGVVKLRDWLDSGREREPLDTEALAQETVSTYASNIQLAKALGGAYGFGVRFYWQPSVYSKASLTDYEQKLEARWPERRALFLAVERAVAQSAELRMEPLFRNLSRAFDNRPEPLYVDAFHLGEPGNELIAQAIAGDVAADLAAVGNGDSESP